MRVINPKLTLSLILLLLTVMVSGFRTSNYNNKYSSADSKIIVVKLHADWCPICKKIESSYQHLLNEFTTKDVYFLKFDLTDDVTKKESIKAVTDLEIAAPVAKIKGTGYILVIDAKTKRQLQVLTSDMTKDDMTSRIKKSLSNI